MTNAQPTPEDELAIDVLIIGGGIQGLLILDRLTAEGRSCALVTASDVGTGQTLHSHGLLNAGFGMMGPELIRLLQEVVLPDLARRGIETYGQWGAIVPPTFPEGELMEPLPGLALRGGRFQRLAEVNVDKRALLEGLVKGLEDRIVRGAVVGVRRAATGQVEGIDVAAQAGSPALVFTPSAVVVSSGTGTKAMLRRLGAGEEQLEPIKHRRVHVLCVRGPKEVLPTLNVMSFPDQLFLAAHERDSTVTWYATPMEWAAPHIEDVPGDAAAEVDPAFITRGWNTMFELYPPLRSLPDLSFTSYAGYRQDVGDMPGVTKCERIDAAPNVIAALPSGLLGAWPVAAGTSALVREIVDQVRPQPLIPGGGQGVRVGLDHEDAAGLAWDQPLVAVSVSPPTGSALPSRATRTEIGD